MKKLTIYLLPLLMAVMMVGCSSDDDNMDVTSPTALYAVLVPDAEQPIDFTPEDHVLTLDNIVSVQNLEETTFKLRNTEKLDSKTLSNYHIWFYSEGRLLFKARLHDALSNMLYSGLVFTHLYTMDGEATYQLAFIRLIHEDGTQEPELTEQEQRGIQQMLGIVWKAGKLKDSSMHSFYSADK